MNFIKSLFKNKKFIKEEITNKNIENNDNENIENNKNIENNNDCINIDMIINKKKDNKNNNNIIKLIIILFLLYIIISSNLFNNTVLKLFGNKFTNNNKPTCLGIIIQGIFLVVFYMIFTHLVKEKII